MHLTSRRYYTNTSWAWQKSGGALPGSLDLHLNIDPGTGQTTGGGSYFIGDNVEGYRVNFTVTSVVQNFNTTNEILWLKLSDNGYLYLVLDQENNIISATQELPGHTTYDQNWGSATAIRDWKAYAYAIPGNPVCYEPCPAIYADCGSYSALTGVVLMSPAAVNGWDLPVCVDYAYAFSSWSPTPTTVTMNRTDHRLASRKGTWAPNGDWAYGNYKLECGVGQYVFQLYENVPSHPYSGKDVQVDSITCGNAGTPNGVANTTQSNCEIIPLNAGNYNVNPVDNVYFGADPYGRSHADCTPGKVVVGIAADTTTLRATKMLCCDAIGGALKHSSVIGGASREFIQRAVI